MMPDIWYDTKDKKEPAESKLRKICSFSSIHVDVPEEDPDLIHMRRKARRVRRLWKYIIIYVVTIAYLLILLCSSSNLASALEAENDVPITNDWECMRTLSGDGGLLLAANLSILLVLCPVLLWKLRRIARKVKLRTRLNGDIESHGTTNSYMVKMLSDSQSEISYLMMITLSLGFIALIYSLITRSRMSFSSFSPFWLAAIIPMILMEIKAIVDAFRSAAWLEKRLKSEKRNSVALVGPCQDCLEKVEKFEVKNKKLPTNISGLKPTEDNLNLVMKDQALRDQFKKFSILEHCMENVLFYEDFSELLSKYNSLCISMVVEEQDDIEKTIRAVSKILVSTYLCSDSPLELNVSEQIKKEASSIILAYNPALESIVEVLDRVAAEVKQMMLEDIFPRFLKWNETSRKEDVFY